MLNEWSAKLASSKNFMKVRESAYKTYTNGWDPSQGSHDPTYNQPNDERISLTNYINWLDRNQTPPASKTSGSTQPGRGAGNSDAIASKSGPSARKNKGSSFAGNSGQGKRGKITNEGL